MAKKLLYVVHRYPPSPGGSEYYVQAMAEESLRRGYDVTVLADYNGELNGVKVTKKYEVLTAEVFDLVIVHGADVIVQNTALASANFIRSPVLYLIIKPSESSIAMEGLRKARFLGCSTQDDFKHCVTHGYEEKIVSVRHSIPSQISDTLGVPERFKKKYGITTPYMFLSAGGFWIHKGMDELADTFRKLGRSDVSMVFLGYMNEELAPSSDEEANIYSFLVEDRQDVLDALVDSDLYIMNSTEEGFGLVLLEAMLNKTPWASRKIAGAVELQQYGFTYTDQGQLQAYMSMLLGEDGFYHKEIQQAAIGCEYVLAHRLIKNTVDDIESVLNKCH